MTSIIEECCLTQDDSDEFDHDCPDLTNEISKKVKTQQVSTLQTDYRERKFFKSSRKLCRNSKIVIQEPKIDKNEVFNVTNELFYPDCNISNIMSIQDGEIKIKREWKKMFKVVEHVRQSHLIQETGEDQEVKDDLEYLIDGISGDHTLSVKIQSALRLVKRSTEVEFRSFLKNNFSSLDLLNIFEKFQSNQKISLCFCCLMIILVKSDLHEEDNSFLIGHLLTWHNFKYPIPDRETWKMVEQLRDFCNGVKGKKDSVVESMVLTNKDIQVSTLTEILIFVMMSRDEKYFEDSEAVKFLLKSVQIYLSDIEKKWTEESLTDCDLFLGLHARLTLLSKWFQMDGTDTIGEYISESLIEDISRICCLFMQICLLKDKNECLEVEFVKLFVAILQCLGFVVLKGIKHHLSAFQDNFMDSLLLFILFLSLHSEQPRCFDLMLLSLELSINLAKADEKFIKTFTDHLSLGRHLVPFKTCKSGIECLAKLFQKMSSSTFKTTKRSSKRLKDSKASNSSTNKSGRCKPPTFGNTFDVTNNSLNVTNNNSSFCLSLNMKDIEGSMNSFIISSYIVVLMGVVISQSPELVKNILRLLPDKSFRSACCLLEDFLQFMTDCNSYQCHEHLHVIIEFLKSLP